MGISAGELKLQTFLDWSYVLVALPFTGMPGRTIMRSRGPRRVKTDQ